LGRGVEAPGAGEMNPGSGLFRELTRTTAPLMFGSCSAVRTVRVPADVGGISCIRGIRRRAAACRGLTKPSGRFTIRR
jgi:hypothetical protein